MGAGGNGCYSANISGLLIKGNAIKIELYPPFNFTWELVVLEGSIYGHDK